MKLLKHKNTIRITAIIAVVSAAVLAAIDFNPDTQPLATVSSYAIKDFNLESGGTNAYRPWHENGNYLGDLIEYNIASSGNRTTNAPVGSYDTAVLIAAAEAAAADPVANNWSARSAFAKKEDLDPADYWKETTGRHIFTGKSGSEIVFYWNNLSQAQKTALDFDTAYPDPDPSDPDVEADTSVAAPTGTAIDSPVLNFLRGDHSLEKTNDGPYRIRYGLLGDIVNSNPVYVGIPRETFTISGFNSFKSGIANGDSARPPFIAVGANDGMLHVFDATDGHELYAYLPSMLIVDPDTTLDADGIPLNADSNRHVSKLNRLKNVPYKHTYFVDGQINVASAISNGAWKTIAAMGLGGGGKGLSILDFTDADPDTNKLLYEITTDNLGNTLGYIYGRPAIARFINGVDGDGNDATSWYVVSSAGYGKGVNKLIFINLNTGTVQYSVAAGINTLEGDGGLTAPALVDTNGDAIADIAFAGDSNGDMWKFNLSDLTSTSATKIFDGVATQPITATPSIGAHPRGGYMVLFGTGSSMSKSETFNITDYPTQALFGIWDSSNGATLVTQVLSEPEVTYTGSTPSKTVRYISDYNAVDYSCEFDAGESGVDDCVQGWRVLLPNSGERVSAPTRIRAGRLTVVTSNPGVLKSAEEPFAIGESYLMSLNYLTGGDANNEVVFNMNSDDDLTDLDKVSVSGVLHAPVGIRMGDGNISQPTIARLGAGSDIMFINGLRLPLPEDTPQGAFLNGHIDVETDSPAGGSKAANNISDMSEGYNVSVNDGLGKAVDGHVHGYDTVHGVNYVDHFELEPRRGQTNLAAVYKAKDGLGNCPAGTIEKLIFNEDGEALDEDGNLVSETGNPQDSRCLDVIDAELNRAFDNLALARPETAATLQSEVYIDGTTPLHKEDQKFIVVLANADLSNGGTLQIGCRSWNVTEYQDMVTEQLEKKSGFNPANLVDDNNISLVFTLESIAAGNVADGSSDGGNCALLNEDNGLSKKETLRIGFNSLSILKGGIHGTRSQCVLGLHDYREPVCYADSKVLGNPGGAAIDTTGTVKAMTCSSGIPANPPDGYIKDPALNLHITKMPSNAGSGYRWRNGALTMQLLDVTIDPQVDLQDPRTLPRVNKTGRFGGTYAQAFTIAQELNAEGELVDIIVPDPVADNHGMLYESTVYWHYSDLADNLRRAPPSSIPCWGDTSYGAALTQELGGLTFGEYEDLLAGLNPDLIDRYAQALQDLQDALNGNGDVDQALLELALLLENEALKAYHDYRRYAPGHVPEHHLINLDKGQVDDDADDPENDSTDDGAPADIETREDTDTIGIGPNFSVGRRTWIDLRQ
jgi:hypothetical protein